MTRIYYDNMQDDKISEYISLYTELIKKAIRGGPHRVAVYYSSKAPFYHKNVGKSRHFLSVSWQITIMMMSTENCSSFNILHLTFIYFLLQC